MIIPSSRAIRLRKPVVERDGSNWTQANPPTTCLLQSAFDRCLNAEAHGFVFSAAAVCLVLIACAITLAIGLPHSAIWSHDIFIVLDGGWRALNGQRPHADFFSSFGPVSPLMTAAGLAAAGRGVEGLTYATVGAGVVLGLWTILIVSRRLKAWSGFLVTAVATLFWLAPFSLGTPFYLASYAMQYNRLGYTLLFIIIVELFVPIDAKRSPRLAVIGGTSTGIALGLLFFLKVSFFLTAFPLLGAAYVFGSKGRWHLATVCSGLLLIVLAALAYLRWDIASIYEDLRLTAVARRVRLSGAEPFRSLARNIGEVIALLGVVALAVSYPASARRRRWTAVRIVPLGLATLIADCMLSASNTQEMDFPLSVLTIVVISEQICRRYLATDASVRGRQVVSVAAMILLSAVTALPVVFETLTGLYSVRSVRASFWAERAQSHIFFDAPHVANLILENFVDFREPAEHEGRAYTELVNEGLELIRTNSGFEDRITCLCFSNPFSYSLLREPSTGGSPFFKVGFNLSHNAGPPAARILGNADVVIHRNPETVPSDEKVTVNTLLKLYGPEIRSKYRLIAESPRWILYKKVDVAGSALERHAVNSH